MTGMKTARSPRKRQDKARHCLEACYPVLVRIFARRGRREDRGLAAIGMVVCNILASSRCTSQLASTAKPLAYLYRAVENALRHKPPKKQILLERYEPIEADGTMPSGVAPCAPVPEPWIHAARHEYSELMEQLIRQLPQPKRAMVILRLRRFSSLEIERTLGRPRATVRYHVSTGIKKLGAELSKAKWRFILTEIGRPDCNPMSA